MPCRSDYLEPDAREKSQTETAQLLTFALNRLGREVPGRVSLAAVSNYGSDRLDALTAQLCGLIRSLPEDQRDSLVYDARNPMSRRLADWWEHHEEADRKRVAEEQRLDEVAVTAELHLSRMSPEDRARIIEAIKLGLVK